VKSEKLAIIPFVTSKLWHAPISFSNTLKTKQSKKKMLSNSTKQKQKFN